MNDKASNKKSQRIEYIDVAKAVGIFLVVIGHLLIFDFYGLENSKVWNTTLGHFIYSFHMPLFIFLSGLVSVTSISKEYILKDLYKRFRTLFVPGVAFVIVTSIIFGSNIQIAFLDDMKHGYWYLFALFGLYLLTYPLAFIKNNSVIGVYVMLFIIAIYSYRHLYLVGDDIKGLFCLGNIIYYLPFFIFANAVKRFQLHDYFFNIRMFFLSFSIWVVIERLGGADLSFINIKLQGANHYLITCLQVTDTIVQYFIKLTKIICVISLCRFLCESTSINYNPLVRVGKDTLYIYLFHYIPIRLAVYPFIKDWFDVHGIFIIDLALSLIFAVVIVSICMFMKRIIDMCPFVRKLLFYR